MDAAVFPSQTFPGCHGINVHATAYYYQFLARDNRPSVCLSVCLSIPLSVTRVDQSKTVHDRITQSSPQCSPMTLVS